MKALSGFKKGIHTVPDVANAVTNAFLGRLCQAELANEAESLFQQVRGALGYKRRELSLGVNSPTATLVAKDFTVELGYELEAQAPARYRTTTTLRELRNVELARTAEFSGVFGGRFTEISFALRKAARVEAIIDALEALDGVGGMSVTYPSDWHECVLRVDGVAAQVRCSGAALEMVFPRGAGPEELIDAFAAVRAAFQISQPLAGLID